MLEAVSEYGLGQWASILRDATYGPVLAARSNVDLKDKGRVLERARKRAGQPSLLLTSPNQYKKKSRAKKVPISAVPAVVQPTIGNTGQVAVIATAIDDQDNGVRQADTVDHNLAQDSHLPNKSIDAIQTESTLRPPRL